MIDVAIIGAGPYGLSLAAHLKAKGLSCRIFGKPMDTWIAHMPKGMRLKSEGFASSLYDPHSAFTLKNYCEEQGLPFREVGLPVPLELFSSYGLEFQRRFVPELEENLVLALHRSSNGFHVYLQDGKVVDARKVVVAVGLSHYDYLPPILSGFSEEFVSHSSNHSDLKPFKGRVVAVIGAGASAVDLAALLHKNGALVELIARKPTIRFHDPPRLIEGSLLQHLREPMTGIGPGWKLWFCTNGPSVFRYLPERVRLKAVRRILGPAPGWFVKDEIDGKVPVRLGVMLTAVGVQNRRIKLELTNGDGARSTLVADHLIAATGYRVNLRRLPFLNLDILLSIRSAQQSPILSMNFESSISGLYFVGASAANTFGPLLRFAFGARFAAERVSGHLARAMRRPCLSMGCSKVPGSQTAPPESSGGVL